jgi:hypothetical protein
LLSPLLEPSLLFFLLSVMSLLGAVAVTPPKKKKKNTRQTVLSDEFKSILIIYRDFACAKQWACSTCWDGEQSCLHYAREREANVRDIYSVLQVFRIVEFRQILQYFAELCQISGFQLVLGQLARPLFSISMLYMSRTPNRKHEHRSRSESRLFSHLIDTNKKILI